MRQCNPQLYISETLMLMIMFMDFNVQPLIRFLELSSTWRRPREIRISTTEVKVNSPDYVGMDREEARKDFMQRMQHYEAQYVPIDDDLDKHWSYIKIFNQGQRYLVNRIEGNINSRIAYYLMNTRVKKRTIYLARHGESELNVTGHIGGDSSLSARGRLVSPKMSRFIDFMRFSYPGVEMFRHGESELNVTGHIGGDSSLSARGRLVSPKMSRFIDFMRFSYPGVEMFRVRFE
ncbi:hypothetical protein AHF37_05476 [Paragonimus kellicotti]|nr:hypothetical protein AHF37_05476 [Paragonimus kellicotti]